jgi:hypothetical protein
LAKASFVPYNTRVGLWPRKGISSMLPKGQNCGAVLARGAAVCQYCPVPAERPTEAAVRPSRLPTTPQRSTSRAGAWARLFGPLQDPVEAQRVHAISERCLYAEACARLDPANQNRNAQMSLLVELVAKYLSDQRLLPPGNVGWRRVDESSPFCR